MLRQGVFFYVSYKRGEEDLCMRGVFIILLGVWFSACSSAARPAEHVSQVSQALNAPATQDIFNRYSRYLDTKWRGNGWSWEVPSKHFREKGENSAGTIRMQATLASFYVFRSDQSALDKMRIAVRNALITVPSATVNAITKDGKRVSTRSFHEAIGAYLGLTVANRKRELFTESELLTMRTNVRDMIPWLLSAEDTESRAFAGSVFTLAAALLAGVSPSEIALPLEQKIAKALTTVENGVYREGADRHTSPHFHITTAGMMLSLGRMLNRTEYIETSREMYSSVTKGFTLVRIPEHRGTRPGGSGLQTALMWAMGYKAFAPTKWEEAWTQNASGMGFIDPRNPDRLVWRDEEDGTHNDDYSFANMTFLFAGELGL